MTDQEINLACAKLMGIFEGSKPVSKLSTFPVITGGSWGLEIREYADALTSPKSWNPVGDLNQAWEVATTVAKSKGIEWVSLSVMGGRSPNVTFSGNYSEAVAVGNESPSRALCLAAIQAAELLKEVKG